MTPELPDGPTEDSTKRNGVFSYAGEHHSFWTGVGVGLAAVVPLPWFKQFIWYALGVPKKQIGETPRSLALREARSEGWYAIGGVVAGILLGFWVFAACAAAVFF